MKNNDSDDITELLNDDDIPDIIMLNAHGDSEPEGPESPANDAASSLLNSSDTPETPSVFGAMAGTAISLNPTPEQQAVLEGRPIFRGEPSQIPDYTVMPN